MHVSITEEPVYSTGIVALDAMPEAFQAKRRDVAGIGLQFKAIPGQFKADLGKRTIEGYFSTWDIDQYDDQFEMGAFAESIARDVPKQLVKCCWNHEFALGPGLEVLEDSKGLLCAGRVTNHPSFDPYLMQVEDGTASHGSIGFTIKDRSRMPMGDGKVLRKITRARLYEFSPVYWPANEAANDIRVQKMLSLGIGTEKKGGLAILAEMAYALDYYLWCIENGPWLDTEEERIALDLIAQISGKSGKAHELLKRAGLADPTLKSEEKPDLAATSLDQLSHMAKSMKDLAWLVEKM